MALPIEPVISLYNYLLAPVPLLAAIGLPVSSFDVFGAIRLALVVQQIKYALRVKVIKDRVEASGVSEKEKAGMTTTLTKLRAGTSDTALSNIWSMLVIVYGGELFVSAFTSQPPSFFTSPIGPIMMALGHLTVSTCLTYAPSVLPLEPNLKWELPLALFDAMARSWLLCSIGPPTILSHKSPVISDSATALLLSTSLMTNGGFFIVNTFSMLSPSGWSVTTPPELQPYGWTSLDLLTAPFITALFATLTHTQTTWRSAAVQATSYMGYQTWNATASGSTVSEKSVPGGAPYDEEHARALCALVLMALFGGRAVKNFGGLPQFFKPASQKLKTQ